jgi:predicted permease
LHYSADQTRAFYRTLTERSRQLAGVTNAALSLHVPFDGASIAANNIAPEGYQFPKGKESDSVFCNFVGERYFETVGTPVVRGRAIQATDTANSPRVAVINEFMAENYWPHQDAIGKRFRILGPDGSWVQVVGITKTGTYLAFGEPRLSFFYLPMAQQPPTRMTLLVETSGDAASLTEPLRNLVRSIDAHQPVYHVHTMREYYQTQGLQALRLLVNLVSGMGLLGLSMALVGLYSLVSYAVSRRTREIGIRMAIGARSLDILHIVLRHGMTLAIIGVGVGLAGSWGVVRLIRAAFTRLQEGSVFDPWTFLVVPAALLAVTLLASYIPARRASVIDPNQALRYE